MSIQQAGIIVDKVQRQNGSIRSLCFAKNIRDKKAVYALVCETLRYSTVIDQIAKAHPFLFKKFPKKNGLCRVLIYNYIIAKYDKDWIPKKKLGGDVSILLQFHSSLKIFLSSLINKKKRQCKEELPNNPKILLPEILQQTVELPRYVRINTLLCSIENAHEHFEKLGYEFILNEDSKDLVASLQLIDKVNHSKDKIYCLDSHLSNLFVFPFGTDLHDDPFVLNGKFILQDKASCLSAIVLLEDCTPAKNISLSSPNKFCNIIDACAAPGNKTTHAAALMNRIKNQHTLFAVDKDDKRILLLKEFTEKANANVTILHQSFLDINSNDPRYENITHLMVDPSCSGSGIVSRLDNLISMSGFTASRKQKLALFQKKILLHALNFTSAKRVVYSTCSLFEEENEQVVEYVLNIVGDKWELHKAIPNWEHRGLSKYSCGEYCIRASPSEDKTNGFFVARFHKKTETETEIEIQTETEIDTEISIGDKRSYNNIDKNENELPSPKKQKITN